MTIRLRKASGVDLSEVIDDLFPDDDLDWHDTNDGYIEISKATYDLLVNKGFDFGGYIDTVTTPVVETPSAGTVQRIRDITLAASQTRSFNVPARTSIQVWLPEMVRGTKIDATGTIDVGNKSSRDAYAHDGNMTTYVSNNRAKGQQIGWIFALNLGSTKTVGSIELMEHYSSRYRMLEGEVVTSLDGVNWTTHHGFVMPHHAHPDNPVQIFFQETNTKYIGIKCLATAHSKYWIFNEITAFGPSTVTAKLVFTADDQTLKIRQFDDRVDITNMSPSQLTFDLVIV